MSDIVYLDTETTSLRPDRRIWDIALLTPRHIGTQPFGPLPGETPGVYQRFVRLSDLDLGNADPFALRIGRFYQRHPQLGPLTEVHGPVVSEADMLHEVERLTRDAHLVGAVPSFDAEVLAARMRVHGIAPSWHHHVIDVEAMAVGYLAAIDVRVELPWKSDELCRACGVDPTPEAERHTALGDARWVQRWHQAITGGGDG